jgi:hypothetical protein
MRYIIGSCISQSRPRCLHAYYLWSILTLGSDENTKEEDLIHPEDIEHFRLHDELEDEAERVAALDKLAIVEQNIPSKFRRDG